MLFLSPANRSRALITGAAAAVLLAVPLLVWQAFNSPLFSEEFVPHGICLLWDPALIRLFVASDTLIGLSYTAISSTLAYFAYRTRRDIPFQWMFVAFAVFIVACGGTHYVDVLTLYVPNYWLSGSVKFITAAASVITAVALPPLVPRVLRLIELGKLAEERRVRLEHANRELEAAHLELGEAHRRLEERYQDTRAELAAIVQGSQDAIISRDMEARVTSWNPAAESLFGYAAEETLGRAVPELLPEDHRDELEQVAQRIAQGEVVAPYETARVRRDGTIVDVSVSTSPVRGEGGALVGFSVIARDITERKRAEAERERLLEQEREARAAAEAALKARDEFLTVAAHELKTPLTSLLGQAQLVLRRLERGTSEPEHTLRALKAVEGQALRSSRLVAQLFDVAQLETGELPVHVEPVDVMRLASDVTAAMQATTQRHRLLLRPEVSPPVKVETDQTRLEQVLTNLLDNAIKFSPDGGEITVEVGREVSGEVRLAVTDQGLGVPPEQHARLFDRYFQGHGGEHRSGMGIGLYVSREIVARLGGRIWAEFPEGGGTRMVVVLPFSHAASAGGDEDSPSRGAV